MELSSSRNVQREWSLLHLASSWFFIKVLLVEIVGAALKMEDDCNEAQRMKIIVVIVNAIFFWSCAGGCDWKFIVNESVDCSSLKCGQDLSQQLALVLSLNRIFLVSERYCNTMVEGSKFLILQKLLGNVLFNNIPCPLPGKSLGSTCGLHLKSLLFVFSHLNFY
ncbi:hypothetical protein ACOSQ4_011040 [Xanthoceras sorbifolium]